MYLLISEINDLMTGIAGKSLKEKYFVNDILSPNQTNILKSVLIGHSFGGAVSTAIAGYRFL